MWLALLADLVRAAPKEQVSTLIQDVRHAWRTWRRTPVLALAAVLTLALGVGANTAVFSVVHGVLLRPLPSPDANRLVGNLSTIAAPAAAPSPRVAAWSFLSWVERAQTFEALAAFNGRLLFTEHGNPERLLGSAVTASLFKVLGIAPIVGGPLTRGFEARCPSGRRARGVVVGKCVWQRSTVMESHNHSERCPLPNHRHRSDSLFGKSDERKSNRQRGADVVPVDDGYCAEPR